jgi:8-oxo-dGTP pyrophosphatase MutT (NUDIX family)
MKLFINDKPIRVYSTSNKIERFKYSVFFDGSKELLSTDLVGDVLIERATTLQIERLFRLLEIKKLNKLKSISFLADDYEFMVQFIKDQFKLIKASGGVVMKDHQILLIHRLGKWDLPKGKLKKKEDSQKGAKREVEEECSIKVVVKDKFCSTWHSYIRKGKRILKKTDWYVMDCSDDSNMRPQVEEFIEDVRWMHMKDAVKAVEKSYASIKDVVNEFYVLHSNSIR